jgi:methionyl-tRNA synthetase
VKSIDLFIVIIAIIVIWETVWKGFALWYASKNNQLNWFIAIFILNTVGILPIVYLKFFQKK